MKNPYWDLVAPLAGPGMFGRGREVGWHGFGRSQEPEIVVEHEDFRFSSHDFDYLRLRDYCVNRWSWTITDPDTVDFVRRHCLGRVVDPMAGTGYWSYLLTQLAADCVSYDLNPPNGDQANFWHAGASTHVEVKQGRAAETVKAHADRTLLLCWPVDGAGEALANYGGDRVIYLGEGIETCGDEQMWELLDKDWDVLDEHRPVLFSGLHDWATTYQRRNQSAGRQ